MTFVRDNFFLSNLGSMLLLLLSRFSRVRLLSTPWTAAHQAPPVHGIFQARVLEWGAIAFSDLGSIAFTKWSSRVQVIFLASILFMNISVFRFLISALGWVTLYLDR